MGLLTIAEGIDWRPADPAGSIYWPGATTAGGFWPRNFYDRGNVIGYYSHYTGNPILPSRCPLRSQINTNVNSLGINQIIAAASWVAFQGYNNAQTVGGQPVLFYIVLPTGHNTYGRFPLDERWDRIRGYIDWYRNYNSISQYAWTIPYKWSTNNQERTVHKNKYSFTDLTEFRDALNEIPLYMRHTILESRRKRTLNGVVIYDWIIGSSFPGLHSENEMIPPGHLRTESTRRVYMYNPCVKPGHTITSMLLDINVRRSQSVPPNIGNTIEAWMPAADPSITLGVPGPINNLNMSILKGVLVGTYDISSVPYDSIGGGPFYTISGSLSVPAWVSSTDWMYLMFRLDIDEGTTIGRTGIEFGPSRLQPYG
jgi:hypothetical protein